MTRIIADISVCLDAIDRDVPDLRRRPVIR